MGSTRYLFQWVAAGLSCLGMAMAWPGQTSASAPVSPAEMEPADGPDGLTCLNPMIDLGEISIGEASRIRCEFRLLNRSTQPVVIEKIAASCGCTVARMKDREVAPGETVALPVEADWSKKPGFEEQSIAVIVKSPKAQSLSLQLKAHVFSEVTVSPETLDFGHLPPGSRKELEVHLKGLDPAILPPSGVEVDIQQAEGLSAELVSSSPVKADSWDSVFRIAIVAPYRKGTRAGKIVFRFPGTNYPDAAVTVFARFPGRMAASPCALYFPPGGPNEGKGAVKQVRVECRAESPLPPNVEVVGEKEQSRPFAVHMERWEYDPGAKAGRATLSVRFDPDKAIAASSRAKLQIALGREILDIPVVGRKGGGSREDPRNP